MSIFRELDIFNIILIIGFGLILILFIILLIINKKNKFNKKNIIDNNNDDEDIELPIIKDNISESIYEKKELNIEDFSRNENLKNDLNIKNQKEYVSLDLNKNKKEVFIDEKFYQGKSREHLLHQTSPIGIINDKPISSNQDNKNKDLIDMLKYEENNTSEEINYYEEKNDSDKKEKKDDFELKKKEVQHKEDNIINKRDNLSNDNLFTIKVKNDDINNLVKETDIEQENDPVVRTLYEIKQEEEAIISYEELMKKKNDSFVDDEEEAIISYEELMRKRESNQNINDDNDKFIEELKKFRSEL